MAFGRCVVHLEKRNEQNLKSLSAHDLVNAMVLNEILDAIPAHIALLDLDGKILAVNAAWREFGKTNSLQSADSAKGENYLHICDRATGEGADDALKSAIGIRDIMSGKLKNFVFEYPCHSPAEPRWFQMRVVSTGKLPLAGAVVMHVDITANKIAEIALTESERQQRALAVKLAAETARLVAAQAVAKIGSWETNLSTLAVTWSAETFRIFELHPSEFDNTHMGFLTIVHPEDRDMVDAAFRKSFNPREINKINHRIVVPGGRIKLVSESWEILTDDSGAPVLARGTCQDVTERISMEQQLYQAQKMEAIGNLTGGLAHDFNNLLGIIIGNLDLLRSLQSGSSVKDPQFDQFSGEALDAALRGADLNKRLLSFARRQTLRPERIDVNGLVEGIGKLLNRALGEHIELIFSFGANVWPVDVDPAQLGASLINMGNNARDAMPKGGVLTITTSNKTLEAAYTAIHPDLAPGDYVLIELSDTGTGIPHEALNQIFEPFFTTKEQGKGTGLGLSMVFGFIKQSQGHITVSSQVDHGTTFRLYLPRASATSIAGTTDKQDASMKGGQETILAVEDNEGLRRIVVRQLKDLGYKVLEAENGPAALEMLELGPIDLLFTDIVMPQGMNGYDLAKNAVLRRPGLKVLMTSGFPEIKSNGHGDQRPNMPLLTKPYRKDDLAQALRKVFEAS